MTISNEPSKNPAVRGMQDGYCFLLNPPQDWRTASDEDFEIEVYSPEGSEVAQGRRKIDGSRCVIFNCPDGQTRAQLEVYVC